MVTILGRQIVKKTGEAFREFFDHLKSVSPRRRVLRENPETAQQCQVRWLAQNGSVAPPVDIDGDPRPMDGNGDGTLVADMGAEEISLPSSSSSSSSSAAPTATAATATPTATAATASGAAGSLSRPESSGLRLAPAKRKIRQRHCSVGRLRQAYSNRAGRVIRQSPSPGATRRRGTQVKLVVGRR